MSIRLLSLSPFCLLLLLSWLLLACQSNVASIRLAKDGFTEKSLWSSPDRYSVTTLGQWDRKKYALVGTKKTKLQFQTSNQLIAQAKTAALFSSIRIFKKRLVDNVEEQYGSYSRGELEYLIENAVDFNTIEINHKKVETDLDYDVLASYEFYQPELQSIATNIDLTLLFDYTETNSIKQIDDSTQNNLNDEFQAEFREILGEEKEKKKSTNQNEDLGLDQNLALTNNLPEDFSSKTITNIKKLNQELNKKLIDDNENKNRD